MKKINLGNLIIFCLNYYFGLLLLLLVVVVVVVVVNNYFDCSNFLKAKKTFSWICCYSNSITTAVNDFLKIISSILLLE